MKTIRIDQAEAALAQILSEVDATGSLTKVFDYLLSCIPPEPGLPEGYLPFDVVYYFLSNFRNAVEHDDPEFLIQHRGLTTDKIVDIIEFAESKEYFGQKGFIRPRIKEELWNLWQPGNLYVEALLCGAIGIGKNFFAEISMGYMLYVLSCYANPQVEFGLAPGSAMVLIQQSVTEKLAMKVIFGQFTTRLSASSYFSQVFPFDKGIRSELRFPRNISVLPVGGSDTGALGMNVFGGCFPGDQKIAINCTELVRMDEWGGGRLLTAYPDGTLATSSNVASVIPTGFKRLCRLCFSDGSSIVCTFDQKFMTTTGVWSAAVDCSGRWLLVTDLSSTGTSSSVACIRVEDLGVRAPVYDVRCVEETHAFLPHLSGSTFLVAHNCIDELNFMNKVESSVSKRGEEYDQAEALYRVLIRRMRSRYLKYLNDGKLPGKLLLISSANYHGDFTDLKKEEQRQDIREKGYSHIFVMDLAQWESIPSSEYSGETFLVEIGNAVKSSRILKSREDAVDDEDVIEVPIEYERDFRRDIEGALKDFAGKVTSSSMKFIPYPERIEAAVVEYEALTDNRSLFRYESVVLEEVLNPHDPDFMDLIDTEYVEHVIGGASSEQPFAQHLDPSLSGDAAGFAVGRIISYKLLPEVKVYDDRLGQFITVRDVRAPVYIIDGILQLLPADGRELDLDLACQLGIFLRSMFYVKWGTMDTYQSGLMIQRWRRAKIKSGPLSVDTDLGPYTEVKLAYKDGRIYTPRHEVYGTEVRAVELNKKGRVDHPKGGSKDTSDAVAGVVAMLQRKEARYGKTSSRSVASTRGTGGDETELDPSRGRTYRRRAGGSRRKRTVRRR